MQGDSESSLSGFLLGMQTVNHHFIPGSSNSHTLFSIFKVEGKKNTVIAHFRLRRLWFITLLKGNSEVVLNMLHVLVGYVASTTDYPELISTKAPP